MSVELGTSDIGNTVPITAASLPLPTGAATDAVLTNTTQKTKIVDTAGTNLLVVNADGSINVSGITAATTPSTNTISSLVSQGKVFTVSGAFSAASAGSDNPIFLIKNPSGSGKTLYLYRLALGCTIANVLVEFKVFYAPTITSNGTSQTPKNNLIGSATASSMTTFSLPTLSSNGTQLLDLGFGQNNNSLDYIGDFSIQLQANQNLVISANPGSNNRTVTITTTWAEV